MWKANKFISYLLWVLSLLSVGVCIYVFSATGDLNPKVAADKEIMVNALNPMYYWVLALIILTLALTILLPIPSLVEHPKSALGIFGGIAAIGLVILIAYMLSSTEALPFTPGHDPVSPETLSFADVNMISTYIMLGGTILALLGTGLVDMLKMR